VIWVVVFNFEVYHSTARHLLYKTLLFLRSLFSTLPSSLRRPPHKSIGRVDRYAEGQPLATPQ